MRLWADAPEGCACGRRLHAACASQPLFPSYLLHTSLIWSDAFLRRAGHAGWLGVTLDWGAQHGRLSPAGGGGAAPAALVIRALGGLSLMPAAGALIWSAEGAPAADCPDSQGFARAAVGADGAVELPAWAAGAQSLTVWVRATADGANCEVRVRGRAPPLGQRGPSVLASSLLYAPC